MLKKRIIPILTFNGLALVKTKQFNNPRMVGNPIQSAKVFNSRNVDELIFVDIFASKQNREINLRVAEKVINECFMPVSIGGGIKSINDINNLLKIGADKVIIKTSAIENPAFIRNAVKIFGAQAIVIAVDIERQGNGRIINHFDKKNQNIHVIDFIHQMEELGVGELCINDVSNDGLMNGFDYDLFADLEKETRLPIIASGGAGKPEHFSKLLDATNVTGIGAASIFHFTQYTPFDLKYELWQHNHPVRIFDAHLVDSVNQ